MDEKSLSITPEILVANFEKLLKDDNTYGKDIQFVKLSKTQVEQGNLEIDVIASLSLPDDKRGLGEILRGMRELYSTRGGQKLVFHQYAPENYKF